MFMLDFYVKEARQKSNKCELTLWLKIFLLILSINYARGVSTHLERDTTARFAELMKLGNVLRLLSGIKKANVN